MRSAENRDEQRPTVSSAVGRLGSSAGGSFRHLRPSVSRPGNGGTASDTRRAEQGGLSDQLAALPNLELAELRLEWRRLFQTEPPRLSRDMTMRAIAYRLQERALGGLAKATQRWLAASTDESDAAESQIAPPPDPKVRPGARLVREWHGRIHTVSVTETGFEFEGRIFRSLTQIAREITGARWSGPRFFGLADRGASARAARAAAAPAARELADG